MDVQFPTQLVSIRVGRSPSLLSNEMNAHPVAPAVAETAKEGSHA